MSTIVIDTHQAKIIAENARKVYIQINSEIIMSNISNSKKEIKNFTYKTICHKPGIFNKTPDDFTYGYYLYYIHSFVYFFTGKIENCFFNGLFTFWVYNILLLIERSVYHRYSYFIWYLQYVY